MDTIAFWPYLIGLVPILLARTWRARRAAILLGLVSMGFGVYFVFNNRMGSGTSDGLRRIGLPIMGALITAPFSVTLTYRLDKKHDTKP